MATIFERILACRSLTIMDYMCEDALAGASISVSERNTLERIYATNILDERYALAHEHLGQVEKAAELRQWVSGRLRVNGGADAPEFCG